MGYHLYEVVSEKNCVVGLRVCRGRDWKWDYQDENGPGTIMEENYENRGWVSVKWDYQEESVFNYRVGSLDNNISRYDLYVYIDK